MHGGPISLTSFKRLGQVRAAPTAIGVAPRCGSLGTIYTVPALKVAILREIIFGGVVATNSPKLQVYVIPSGVTDLTGVATDMSVADRARAENKNCYALTADAATITGPAVGSVTVVARNTILQAGDAIAFWCHINADPTVPEVYAAAYGLEVTA